MNILIFIGYEINIWGEIMMDFIYMKFY